MKISCCLLSLVALLYCLPAVGQEKPILIVTTDIGQDPDDLQSLIRLLHYSNEFNIQGLIANADQNYKHEAPILKDSIIHECLDAYALIENNLRLHDPNYPRSSALREMVKQGCAGNGNQVAVEEYIGEDLSTEGSNHIIQVVAAARKPVHLAVWGGGADLAQALYKVRSKCRSEHFSMFLKKLRVYFIGKQDSSVDWIINEFPDLWKVVALDRQGDKWESTYRGVFYGGNMDNTSKEWLTENILEANPLAAMYPTKSYTGGEERNPFGAMKEGDTPSWFFFLENNLNDPSDPTAGGWGGRFEKAAPNHFVDACDRIYDESVDSVSVSQRATIFRWREDFQNDFAARAAWGSKDYKAANHHPEIKLVDFEGISGPWYKPAMGGNTVVLDARSTIDPDKDKLTFDWMVYPEASTYPYTDQLVLITENPGELQISIPRNARGKSIHLILKVIDDGKPALTSYQRIVLEVE